MTSIIAHVGFPKTGTTYLQHNVFPNLDNLEYIDHVQSKRLLYDIITKDVLDYDLNTIKNDIHESRQHQDLPMLLSQEQLCGSVFLNLGANKSQIASSLKFVGVNKVIIGIRNQFDAIESLYKQYIHEGGVLKFDQFFTNDNINRFNPVFNPSFFNYHSLITHYMQIFGSHNVLIICNEDLKNDEGSQINRITEFIGENITYTPTRYASRDNASLGSVSLQLLRISNLFTYNRFRPFGLLGSGFTTSRVRKALHLTLDNFRVQKSKLLNENQRNEITKWYSTSNRELANQTGINLKDKGYPW